MGYLGSEEINSFHVHLCYHRELSTRSVLHSFNPFCRLALFPRDNYRKGHLEQRRFAAPHFLPSTDEFSKIGTPVDPRLPPEYSYCEIIVSSVGKLWVLPYLLIISYQLRASSWLLSAVSSSHDGHKSNPDFDAHQDIPAPSFYPASCQVLTFIHTPD